MNKFTVEEVADMVGIIKLIDVDMFKKGAHEVRALIHKCKSLPEGTTIWIVR